MTRDDAFSVRGRYFSVVSCNFASWWRQKSRSIVSSDDSRTHCHSYHTHSVSFFSIEVDLSIDRKAIFFHLFLYVHYCRLWSSFHYLWPTALEISKFDRVSVAFSKLKNDRPRYFLRHPNMQFFMQLTYHLSNGLKRFGGGYLVR